MSNQNDFERQLQSASKDELKKLITALLAENKMLNDRVQYLDAMCRAHVPGYGLKKIKGGVK